jgi:hypothetical protein
MGLEKLREIGAHKIFEQTHIARKFVEDILKGNFSTMNRVQFAGFISILEREYNVDLHELTEEYNAHYNADHANEKEPFVVSIQENSEKTTHTKMYVAVALVLAGVALAFYSFLGSSKSEEPLAQVPVEVAMPEKEELNNTTIEEARSHLGQLDQKTAETSESTDATAVEVTVEPVHIGKFEIIPRSNLWIGIIDLDTFQRTQKLGSEPFELASDKEWLLVMGHGYVNFSVNGEEKRFKEEKKVWFSYENGVLRQLSRSEFKEKNRGKAW